MFGVKPKIGIASSSLLGEQIAYSETETSLTSIRPKLTGNCKRYNFAAMLGSFIIQVHKVSFNAKR